MDSLDQSMLFLQSMVLQFLMKRPKFNTQFFEMMICMMGQIMQKVISKVQNALGIAPKNGAMNVAF
jgi:hypothetical protein